MPRPSNVVPTLRHHKASGRAFVCVNGRNIYVGKWGTDAAQTEYLRLCREILAGRPVGPKSDPRAAASLTVAELAARFRVHALGYYRHPDGSPTDELQYLQQSVKPLVEQFGERPAAEFGPLALKELRQTLVDAKLSRSTINGRVNRIRRVFRWGVSEELIPGSVLESLRAVPALKKGRTTAREPQPILPVSDAVITATLPYLTPTVAAMVRVQRLTGMRPGEVTRLIPGELDRSSSVWAYRPAQHKTSYRGTDRVVWIGPEAQAILLPRLDGLGPDAPVFSPACDQHERYAAMRAKRKTRVQPSQQDRSVSDAKRKRSTPDVFARWSYESRIRTAARRAGVPHWHPNQLRHTFATEVRKRYGLEAAQVLLGHERANVTEIYAERNLALAEKVAREIG